MFAGWKDRVGCFIFVKKQQEDGQTQYRLQNVDIILTWRLIALEIFILFSVTDQEICTVLNIL